MHAKQIALLAVALVGCATAEKQEPSPVVSAADEADGDADAEDAADEPAPPRTWAEARARFSTSCPVEPFTLVEPRRVTVGEAVFVIEGSRARREGAPFAGGATFGVLGAVKDASDGTRENLAKARELFAARGVDVVVVNGDLGEDREVPDVISMLAETFQQPLFVHSGNMEWASAFARAMAAAEEQHAHVFDLNWITRIDLDERLHLLALPGYHELHFLKPGACRYGDDQIERLLAEARALRAAGGVVVLTSHGPPKQEGKAALDVAYDDAGNVGDPRLTRVLEEGDVKIGLFSHILEAGGRATADARGKQAVKLPVRRPLPSLYVNAGSASAFPWRLLDGKTSEGMAMVVTVAPEGVTAEVLRLR